jgi:hypothetical protein
MTYKQLMDRINDGKMEVVAWMGTNDKGEREGKDEE